VRRGIAAALICLPACSLFTSLGGYSDDEPPGSNEAGPPDARNDDVTLHPETGAPISAYRDAVMFDGPRVYLRFGETHGTTTTARDETGQMNGQYSLGGVTLGAPGALVGDPDTALALDGSGRVTMPAGLDFGGKAPFTVEAWFKTAPTIGMLAFIVDHEEWPGGRRGWLVAGGNVNVGLERYVNPSTNHSVSILLPRDDAWHYLVTIYDGTRSILYVDGAERAAGGPNGLEVPPTGTPWSIGQQNCACSGNAWVGALDEIAIYDKALSEPRIFAHYRASGR
jgi:hypothetical protein